MTRIEFDPVKNALNIARHGMPLSAARHFKWERAMVVEDVRNDYQEVRFQAIGFIGDRLHVLVFTPRGKVTRVISLRKANRREERHYANYP